jgi:hypothetical protein
MSPSRPLGIPPRLRSAVLCVATVIASASAAGCSTHYIPNTDVEDSEENRKLIAFCERYRHAVELKNISLLLKLASPKYYEDGGNVDAADDLDYAGLKDYLTNKFQDARSIRYEIRYRRVVKDDDRIFIDYTYSASYRIPGLSGEEWKRKVDDNRLELIEHDNEYRIIAGM